MGDEYVSTEHLLIAIAAAAPNQSARHPRRRYGVTADGAAQGRPRRCAAVPRSPARTLRARYKALEKYSTDLTAAAPRRASSTR